MKKQKNVKKWKIEKKTKLTKAMIITIISFCSFCCFALNIWCGLALLGMGALLYYIVSRPVDVDISQFLHVGVDNDKDA